MMVDHGKLQTRGDLPIKTIDGIIFHLPHYVEPKNVQSAGRRGGTVLLANDPNKNIAIKKYNFSVSNLLDMKLIFREIEIWPKIKHKNILKFFTAYTPSDIKHFNDLYFVVEYMDFPLSEIINQRSNYFQGEDGIRQISHLTYQLFCGLNYLHCSGITHGALTPNNIMLNEKSHIKITDMGSGSVSSTDQQNISISKRLSFYRAPEMIFKLSYDCKVDVWSAGCILIELLTGRNLFKVDMNTYTGKESEVENYILEKILELLGRPSSKFLDRLSSDFKEYIQTNIQEKLVDWHEILPNQLLNADNPLTTVDNARDLISKMIKIEPGDRIFIHEVLKHTFVNWKQKEGDFKQVQWHYSEWIDQQNLNFDQLKKMIFDKVQSFQEEKTGIEKDASRRRRISDADLTSTIIPIKRFLKAEEESKEDLVELDEKSKKVTNEAQNEAENCFNLAKEAASEGKHDKAIDYYTKAIKNDCGYSEAYARRASYKILLNQFEEAIEDCDRAIHFNSDLVFGYRFRGDAREKLGDKALDEDKNMHKAYELFIDAHKDYIEANEIFEDSDISESIDKLTEKIKDLEVRIIAEQSAASEDQNMEVSTQETSQKDSMDIEEVSSAQGLGVEKITSQVEDLNLSGKLRISLMDHQRIALNWMKEHEKSNTGGGILADDMGFGKTLSAIALILFQKHHRINNSQKNDSNLLVSNATLVVVLPTLLMQWEDEIKKYVNEEELNVIRYHGTDRESDPTELASYDIVLTTYSIIESEIKTNDLFTNIPLPVSSPLLHIKWARIILDEAHYIRNHNTHKAKKCCLLEASNRWCLTGTPIQNSLWDLFSLIKFLRVPKYKDRSEWMYILDPETDKFLRTRGFKYPERMYEAISDFLKPFINVRMMRREKKRDQTTNLPIIVPLPRYIFNIEYVNMTDLEYKIYVTMEAAINITRKKEGAIEEHNFNEKEKEHVFSVIMRLRQACIHFNLTQKVSGKQTNQKQIVKKKLLQDNVFDENTVDNELDSIFNKTAKSSKLNKVFEIINRIPENEKIVIVSQFVEALDLVKTHFLELDQNSSNSFVVINGKSNFKTRHENIRRFNEDKEVRIMFLSLRTGCLGLNLIGGNHMILLDPHWNPATEQQVFDRIFRIGQTKDVYIYKLICKHTIEEKVLDVQRNKNELANRILPGAITDEDLIPEEILYLVGKGPDPRM